MDLAQGQGQEEFQGQFQGGQEEQRRRGGVGSATRSEMSSRVSRVSPRISVSITRCALSGRGMVSVRIATYRTVSGWVIRESFENVVSLRYHVVSGEVSLGGVAVDVSERGIIVWYQCVVGVRYRCRITTYHRHSEYHALEPMYHTCVSGVWCVSVKRVCIIAFLIRLFLS